jgi:hypothetical protein
LRTISAITAKIVARTFIARGAMTITTEKRTLTGRIRLERQLRNRGAALRARPIPLVHRTIVAIVVV